MGLTKDQEKFVDHGSGNVLLSASAGSGKTTTMVAKQIKLIVEDRVPIKNILTLTFTRAAANKMRADLYKELVKYLNVNPHDEFVANQLEDINLSDIGTIDSLCNKLVKKYFYVIGIDPAFELLEKNEENYIVETIIKQVCQDAWKKDKYFGLYENYLSKRSPRKLFALIKSLYDFVQVMPNYKEYFDYVLNDCYNQDVNSNKCAMFLLDCMHNLLAPYQSILTEISNLYAGQDDKCDLLLNAHLGFVKEFLATNSYTDSYRIVQLFDPPALPGKTKATEYKQELKEFKSDFEKVLKQINKYIVKFDETEFAKVKHDIIELFELTQLVIDTVHDYKVNNGVLGFSDTEHYTYDILQNESVRKECMDTYKYIFFDEYQDINILQDSILALISNNNLNLIGDVKQSIYEFRQSTPQLFIDKTNLYRGLTGTVINLNENFRSNDNILQFVNSVFSSVITPNTMGIDYKGTSQLIAGKQEHKLDYNCVELDIINKVKPSKENQAQQADDELDYVDKEVQLVVGKIKDLINEGYTYSDIAILLRDRKDMVAKLTKVLNEYNIPCYINLKTNIFDKTEITMLCSLLNVINNNFDDIACATMLVSPIFKLDENDLIQISKLEGENFYNKVQNATDNIHLQNKVQHYFDYIDGLRHYLINHSVKEMLDKVIADNDLYTHYLSMPDGQEIMTYINTFLDMMKSFDNVSSAIEYINAVKDNSNECNILPGTKNAITLSTIHGSKGLEYKCVILCSCGRNISIEKDDDINLSTKYGVGIKYLDINNGDKNDVFVKKACLLDKNHERINEEMRLLYVALTRAEKKLIVVGSYNVADAHKVKLTSVYSAKNYFDIIFKSFSDIQFGKFGVEDSFVLNDGKDSRVVVNVYDDYRFESEDVKPLKLDNVDTKLASEIKKYLDYEYPQKDILNVATKNSVSSMIGFGQDYVNVVESLSDMLGSTPPNAKSLELGTAYHLVMQSVDYFGNNDIRQIIDKLVLDGLLDFDVAKLIDVARIENAVQCVKSKLTDNCTIYKEQQFTMRGKHSEFVSGGLDVTTIVQGAIDLAIENEGGIVLIDFKTNKTDEKHLIETYATQLHLYAKALEKHSGKKVREKLLYSFHLQKFVEVK